MGGRPDACGCCRHQENPTFVNSRRRIELEMPTVKVTKEFSIEFLLPPFVARETKQIISRLSEASSLTSSGGTKKSMIKQRRVAITIKKRLLSYYSVYFESLT